METLGEDLDKDLDVSPGRAGAEGVHPASRQPEVAGAEGVHPAGPPSATAPALSPRPQEPVPAKPSYGPIRGMPPGWVPAPPPQFVKPLPGAYQAGGDDTTPPWLRRIVLAVIVIVAALVVALFAVYASR